MRTQFRFRRDDYKQLLVYRPVPAWRGLIRALMPVVGFPLLVFGSLGVYWLHTNSAWMLAAVAGLVLILARPLSLRAELWRGYTSQDFEVDVQESGVEVRSHVSASQYSWSNFRYFRPTKKHFILFFRDDDPLILPRRAFSAEELNAVDAILHRHLPDRLPSSHGGT